MLEKPFRGHEDMTDSSGESVVAPTIPVTIIFMVLKG